MCKDVYQKYIHQCLLFQSSRKEFIKPLSIYIYTSTFFDVHSVSEYTKIGKNHVFQGIIQAVNCDPTCMQNAAQFMYYLKHDLSNEEIDQCLHMFCTYDTISTRQFFQALFIQKVFSKEKIEQIVPKEWITDTFL